MDWKNIRFAGRTALALIVALTAWQPATAQVIVVSGRGGFDGPNVGTVKLKVVEEKTQAPIPYASVYLTAKNDTLITNFTVTDTLGVAQIKKVTLGTYKRNSTLAFPGVSGKSTWVRSPWRKIRSCSMPRASRRSAIPSRSSRIP